MTKRRRILHADKIIQNIINVFCLLMFLQLKGYYSLASNPILLYSTASDIRVVNVSAPDKTNVIIEALGQGSAVDFLYKENMICWSDQTAELIQCMTYNKTYSGDTVRIVSEGIITPTGIAIDWYTSKIYWTDGETNRIEVISIRQKHRKVLFWSEVDLARGIAVVPSKGLIFWTDWGEIPKIEKAGMDGDPESRKVIVKDDIYWPNGITVDYDYNLIYWVDSKLHFVDVIDFSGENRRRIIKKGLQYPYAPAFFNSKLYWTDWSTWYIYTWDISTNGPIRELLKSKTVPVDIRVYDESRQPMPTTDYPCKYNNGGCSHLCLLSSTSPGYICACPTGVTLEEASNTTCNRGPRTLLLVAQRTMISKISLDMPDYTPYTLPLKDLRRAIAVDFDPKTEYMYWADSLSKTISRARLDGSDQSVVLHIEGLLDSIAIDPSARNIYWTDPLTDTINVARLNGSSRKVIIHDDLYDPRAIALHPSAGYMFWSDWNDRKPKIERANLDGSERILLISEKITWPNGIALDTVNNKLYWGDGKTHKIEACNLDGSGRREIHGSDITHIYGLTLLDNHLYWTDIQRRTLERIVKTTGSQREAVVDQMANMMGVKAIRLGAGTNESRCASYNAGCSHLCFNRPLDYVCGCPLGLELSGDNKTCVEPEAFLVYSRKNNIGRISIENEGNHAVLPIKELRDVNALAVHVSGSKIYWSDTKTKTINRCSVNGANMEKLVEFLGLVEGLAIDWSAQNMYWTDTTAQRIEAARLDGSSRRALVWQGLKKPKSIALDPKRGYMYWSELGTKAIKRAGMDGSSPGVLVEQAGRAHSLAIDYESRHIYWTALDPPAVECARLDGSARRLLASDVQMPYAIALYNDRVFWGDWNSGYIQVANKTDGSNRKILHSNLEYISDLKVYHRSKSAGGNQCGVDNGGCSHLCLPLPADGRTDFRCGCPAHYKLNKDNLTCSEPEEFMLYAQKNALGRIMIANGECNDAFIPLTSLKNVKAIEYDPITKVLFWMEEDSHEIRQVPISHTMTSASTDSTPLITGLSRPFHMVLDVLGRALYWTCLDTDSINATSIMNESYVGVILRGDNMMPRHLAFHQTKRVLIWNDVGLGAIMRANVDGTNRSQLARVSNATALTLDQVTSTVYWAVGKQIHAVDLDYGESRVVWQGGWSWTICAFGGALYLGGGERALLRLPLHRRDAPAMPVSHVARILAAVAVHSVSHEHPCYGGRRCGGAPGACGVGGACGCALHCAQYCAPGLFACHTSSHLASNDPVHCIPQEWKCDGQADCPDGSDEGAECGACALGVRCAGGTCADALGACPAGALCPTHPLPDAFRCDDRLCLPARLLCDGHAHCKDGSDEAPDSCAYGQKDQVVTGAGGSNALVVCGGIGGVVAAAAGAWAALRRWRRRAPAAAPRVSHAARPLCALKPLEQRARPLGASCTETSESTFERYPRPTANPPPSPATASGGSAGGGAAGGRRRAYRHYRAMNRPPPPTPASTDACESEPESAARAPPPSPAPLLY